MIRRTTILLSGILLVALVFAASGHLFRVQAQTQPTAIIDAAYRDLSQKLGKSIARGGDSSFTWEQDSFGDTRLGCPKPGVAASQVVTPGYKIVITFQGVAYDYRATLDGKTLFQCSATGGIAITATVVNTPIGSTAVPAPGPTTITNALAFVDKAGNVNVARPGENGVSLDVPLTTNSARQTSGTTVLPQFTHAYGQFRWSPDGTKLLYTDLINETLYAAISGQAPIFVARAISTAFPGAWSQDGSKIAYAVSTQQQQPPNGVVQQVQAVTLTGTPGSMTVSAPQYAGAFVMGVGCGGGVLDPADVLYMNEAGYGGNGLTLAWTAQGFVHSTACTGVGLALTDPNGKDLWTIANSRRVAVSPDRTRAVAIGVAQNGTNNTGLSLIDLATGNQSPLGTQPGVDQVAWSADGQTIVYSALAPSTKVAGNASSAVGQQLLPMWPVNAVSYTVTLWRMPATPGPVTPTQLFQRDGRGIGVIAPAPDNSSVAFSFITATTDIVQQINNGAAAAQAVLVQPHVTIFSAPWNGGAQPSLITEGGQPAYTSGTFAVGSGSTGAVAGPTIAPTPNLPPPALVIGKQAVVSTTGRDTLNMREAPGLSAKVLRILKQGAVVTIMAGPQSVDSLRWWQVRADDGTLGWVADQVTDQNGTVNMLTPQ